jgi:hypothetical protein
MANNPGEEQQQEEQRQRVLDPDQQPPDFACETHAKTPLPRSMPRRAAI